MARPRPVGSRMFCPCPTQPVGKKIASPETPILDVIPKLA